MRLGGQKSSGRPILSKAFVATLVALGATGMVSSMAAAGTNGTNNQIYYAQTGADGMIHCAGYNVSIGTGGGTVAALATTYVKESLFCATNDSYPSYYFEARGEIINSSNQLCADTGWAWNSSPSSVSTYISEPEANCKGYEYYNLGQSDAAVNLGWQYTAASSGWAPS